MRTSLFQAPISRLLPVQCVLYVPHDERQGLSTIHHLSLGRCHVETPLKLCPGMMVSLYLILPSAPQDIVVERAIVTWAWRGECGVQVQHLQPAEAYHLRQLLTTSY